MLLVVGIIGAGAAMSDALGAIGALLGFGLTLLVPIVLQVIIQAQITRAGLALTRGQTPDMNLLLATGGLPQVALGAVLIGFATFIGILLCVIPGLLVGFFTQFFVHYVLDRGLPAIEAIKASVRLVMDNLAVMVVFFLASYLAYSVGGLVCGLGILVAMPVVVIAQAYLYRRLQGETVAA